MVSTKYISACKFYQKSLFCIGSLFNKGSCNQWVFEKKGYCKEFTWYYFAFAVKWLDFKGEIIFINESYPLGAKQENSQLQHCV